MLSASSVILKEKVLSLYSNCLEFNSTSFWMKEMTLKSGLADVYISYKTDFVELATILDFINIVSFACNLMTFWEVKLELIKILVDPRLKPIGKYKVELAGNIIWGCEVLRLTTV